MADTYYYQSSSSTSSGTTTDVIWSAWCSQGRTASNTSMNVTFGERHPLPHPQSDAEIEAIRKSEEEKQKRNREAAERAKVLLMEHLDRIQIETLTDFDYFCVKGKSGKWYRINKGTSNNIRTLDKEGKSEKKLCVHLNGDYPVYDHMLAQMLHLQFNDEELIKKANISSVWENEDSHEFFDRIQQ